MYIVHWLELPIFTQFYFYNGIFIFIMEFLFSIFCLASKNQIRCNVAKARLFLRINEQKHQIAKRFCRKIEMYMENYIRATIAPSTSSSAFINSGGNLGGAAAPHLHGKLTNFRKF